MTAEQAPEGASQNPWGGRFAKPIDELVEAYGSSIEQDRPLLPYDIRGSIAHARMLGRQGIIPAEDAGANVTALEQLAEDATAGRFELRAELEDVHMNVEAELERRIGAPARRLHTARSRNDQVITDFRLLVRDGAAQVLALLRDLQRVLLDLAAQHVDTIMPGYTHLQVAQPVVLAHHLLAYWQMLARDVRRFRAVYDSANVSPLGSGALAGSPYPLDREAVAAELGFAGITENSMDAVSDRDFLLEFHAAAAICMAHVSRLAEEIILWSTREFGFITLDDAFATGSSIMPQKKNPDVAELARGRTGPVFGNLMATLSLIKALPLTYNRDLQLDKPPYLQSFEILTSTLQVFAAMLPTITWNTTRMREAAVSGYALATDVADYLVRKGLPFREAHGIVGRLVAQAVADGKELHELSLAQYRALSPLFEEDVLAISAERAVDGRDVPGGTSRRRVREQLAAARAAMAADESDDARG
ncbi:MAG TPA: argininosuccinate lyase [Dehalococcoidia bacterium]|nr:argininosuccinate lyase [Dehalococcoidia bacterium]